MNKRISSPGLWSVAACIGMTAVFLASCTSSRAPQSTPTSGGISGPIDYSRPHRDGAPWWDVDVSRIPDAVPMRHNGPVKNNPYTVLGKTYYPLNDARTYNVVGTASWYGTKFHGQATANGEQYDLYGMTAAHKTLPLPSYVRVTNLDNGKSVIVRVNDRGPFYSDRVIDLSFAAAKKLGYAETGTAHVKVEGIDPDRWWAAQGRSMPMVLAQPKMATPQPAAQPQAVAMAQPIETYTPPPEQHAVPVAPVQIDSKKRFITSRWPVSPGGCLRQPGRCGTSQGESRRPDGAKSFISSVVVNQQTLYRVRLGPINTQDEASRMQDSIRVANLGQPKLVRLD